MFAALALAFLVVPFAELFVIIKVGSWVGAVPTIIGLAMVSIIGAALVRKEGLSVIGRARGQIQAGIVPGVEIVDGVMILVAGALLLTPGFITDVFGIALLIPPVRNALRTLASRRLEARYLPTERRW